MEPAQLIDLLSSRETELIRAAAQAGGPISLYADAEDGIVELSPSGWPDEVALPSQDDVARLESLGVVDGSPRERGWGLQINLTGRRVASELERRARCARPGAVDPSALQWSAVAPHLRSIHDEWFAQGRPAEGVELELTSLAELDEATRDAVVEQLHEEGYVVHKPSMLIGFAGAEAHTTPAYVRPSPKTISEYGGWPATPELAQQQMLEAIDALLSAESTPEADKGRLTAVRDNIAQMAAGTAWGLLMAQFGLPG